MILHGLPIVTALVLWWFSTGVILYLDGLPQRTFRLSMAGATLLAAGAVVALTRTSTDTSVAGGYEGFAIGLTIWGWLEVGYYMGFMVGPRRHAEPGSTGWRHFRHAAETTLYHELAALALAAVIFAVTWDMPNKAALWTFLILWVMQLSAKLNVFLGVQNLAENFLPPHLAFLRHYMTRKPMNLFFPLAVTLSMVLATLLVEQAATTPSPFAAVQATMLASLVVLAILEHWVLVLPLPVEALWAWSLGSRAGKAEATTQVSDPPPSRKLSGTAFADPGLATSPTPFISRRHP